MSRKGRYRKRMGDTRPCWSWLGQGWRPQPAGPLLTCVRVHALAALAAVLPGCLDLGRGLALGLGGQFPTSLSHHGSAWLQAGAHLHGADRCKR